MTSSWWVKMAVIFAAFLGSIYVLTPTVLETLRAEEARQAAVDSLGSGVQQEEVPLEGWEAMLPKTKLVLGLDLQGGIDLTLDVDIDEAIHATVGRDVQPVLDAAEREGVVLDDVRRVRGEPSLDIKSATTDLGDIQDFMVKSGYQSYRYLSTEDDWHRFEMTEEAQDEVSEKAIEQAVELLRSRVNETGVKEPSIVRKGEQRINVQLPGITNLEQAVAALGTTAVLEFYMVDEDFEQLALEKAVQAALDAIEAGTLEDDDTAINDWLLDTNRIGSDNKVLFEYEDNEAGEQVRSRPYALLEDIILTGDDVNDASVGFDGRTNMPNVSMEFKPKGARIFGDVTGDNVGKRFAIVLDKKVRSAPVINERIGGGRAQISMGSGGYDQARDDSQTLALVLRTGALPAPVSIGEVHTVGAQLGEDAIKAGSEATVIGMLLVLLAMLVYYRKPGVVASMALVLNVFFVMAALAAFGATLTLPGIAGIALTVGMAVDANIIIYERIREELAVGKNARSAVDAGYEHALSAVLDANITTGIAGVVLYSYGSGPIKGFAVTLLVGIATTLFTAIFVSRTFMDFAVRKSSARLSF